ncbi:MAG: hypothetical protein LBR37_01555 [Erysipelotrichaceae bacterium]|jgi:hypothetical protein|nr:hypothetical protein [Erysipelotrichaceae bacterium]
MKFDYRPEYTLTSKMIDLVAQITEYLTMLLPLKFIKAATTKTNQSPKDHSFLAGY